MLQAVTEPSGRLTILKLMREESAKPVHAS
jgi:hypothetical protein